MSEPTGAKAALADLHEPPAPDDGEARQIGLFLETSAPAPGAAGGDAGQVERTGKAGRPKGARNRSTEEWRRHLLSRYSSPLEGLLKIASAGRDQLAQEVYGVKFDKLERAERLALFDRRAKAAEAAVPYLHQKQPQAFDLGEGSTPLVFVNVPHGATKEGEQDVIDLLAGDYSAADDDEPESADNSEA